MKTLTVINHKGGTGKSTIAAYTAQGLAKRGNRVLVIDTDHQQSLSDIVGIEGEAPSIMDVLEGKADISDAIKKAGIIDAIPSDERVALADIDIKGTGKEYRLKESLSPIADSYDYVVIDVAPHLGIMAINALTASDACIIPAPAEHLGLKGVLQLQKTLDRVRKKANPNLQIAGILLSRTNNRYAVGHSLAEVMKQAASIMNTRLFNTTIREAVAIKDAQAQGRSLYDVAPKAKVTQDFNEYIDELVGVL